VPGSKAGEYSVHISTAALQVGEQLELCIEVLAYGGEGIARHKGLVVFIAGGLPGERVQVRITHVKKRFARGEMVKIIKASANRIGPICALAGECGGCTWWNLAYPAQLQAKQKFVENALSHIGRLKNVGVLSPIQSSPQLAYRHKIQIPIQGGENGLTAGFFRHQSHCVIPLDHCPIQPPVGNRIFKQVMQLCREMGYTGYREKTGEGLLRNLLIRIGANTNEVLAVLVTAREEFPRAQVFADALRKQVPELVGIVQNIQPQPTNVILGSHAKVLSGRPYLYEEIGGIRYRVSAESFFQINPFQLPRLLEAVMKAAEPRRGDTVIDLFCGVGFLTLHLARQVRRIFGVEYVGKAVADAEYNKHLNNLGNVDFYTGEAAQALSDLVNRGIRPDLIILDPPRKGCEAGLLKTIAHSRPKKVVYVSCNPITLARDLGVLSSKGYHIGQVQPIDLFPYTYHIESVVRLLRNT
ncbi:23S rRNA (uracil(1939)-C(5))-methyltransferase RlmD, partial [candidate division FCPU426 bacterium]|nr:23S rRNA (uracil(1939)-C(5))-methyltransferase RlmD [candidate division FCPU426 bacterium]